MNPYLPCPDLDQLQAHGSFEEAMEAYAIYARDNDYPYLAAWRPWLRMASQVRKAYPDELASDAAESQQHFSTRMSILRNRLVTQVFGHDGLDRTGTALMIFNSALRTAEQNGMLAEFCPCLLYTSPSPRDRG